MIQGRHETSSFIRHTRHRRVLLICAAVFLALSSTTYSAQTQRPRLNASRGPVRVQLFDIYSGLPLANAAVEVESDDGIVCKMAPCPTDQKTWLGRSDDSGAITIPPSAIQVDTYVKTKGHRLAKLADDAIQASSNIHPIELYPEWLFDEQHDWTRGYKLVDPHGKVLANVPVRIEFSANDWPAQHGGISSLDLKTNPLGYVFFSFLRKPDPKPGQNLPDAPLADWMTPVASVAISGYRKVELNYFDGSDDERSLIRLQQ